MIAPPCELEIKENSTLQPRIETTVTELQQTESLGLMRGFGYKMALMTDGNHSMFVLPDALEEYTDPDYKHYINDLVGVLERRADAQNIKTELFELRWHASKSWLVLDQYLDTDAESANAYWDSLGVDLDQFFEGVPKDSRFEALKEMSVFVTWKWDE